MSIINAWIYALWRELQAHKGKVAIVFAVLTFVVLAVGLVWPKTYESSGILFADEQNIIKPLLSGSAEVTKPESVDQVTVARERILSNSNLERVLLETKLVKNIDDKYAIELPIRALRAGIDVVDAGKGQIKISYKSSDKQKAFAVTNAAINVFMRDSARSKREESQEAFVFIDNQVKTYKSQLEEAEDRLKTFKGSNFLGSEDRASSRISDLRATREAQRLDLQVARARRDELRSQITQENQHANRRYKSGVYRERLAQAQAKLDTLRLSYEDTYPDIVSLKQQIADMQHAIQDAENDTKTDSESGGANPVYDKLRGDLADAEVQMRTLELKLASTEKLIDDEQSHSKNIAESQATLSELTRDYNVTKKMYEDMLERKEKARLSMALDIEGQGVNYKIKEPPIFPTRPIGLRFVHFFMAAPVAGLLIPFALLVAYIQFDPRIRFAERLEDALPEGVIVFGVVPHISTRVEMREMRAEWTYIGIFLGVVLLIYLSIALVRLLGVV